MASLLDNPEAIAATAMHLGVTEELVREGIAQRKRVQAKGGKRERDK